MEDITIYLRCEMHEIDYSLVSVGTERGRGLGVNPLLIPTARFMKWDMCFRS